MTRPGTWKVFAFAAAMTGLGMAGAPTAAAQLSTTGSDTTTSRPTDAVRGGPWAVITPIGSDSADSAGSDTSTSKSNDGSRGSLRLPGDGSRRAFPFPVR
ncbi:MAG: hypothetical protein KDB71_13680 [Mycobacterium sp.]|nr:hypothetical protein [Mycobacterium sp.]